MPKVRCPAYREFVLIGRHRECARIERFLEQVRAGASSSLVFSGGPGVGKTTLLEFARSHASGLSVVSTTAVESEERFPYGGLSHMLEPLLPHIDALPDLQARSLRGALALGEAAAGDRFSVYAATFQLLAGAAERAPLLALIDDVQWLDQPTIEALEFVIRRLRAEGIGILLATRDPNGFPGADRLSLAGLDEVAAEELLTTRLRLLPDPAVLRALIARLDGNPLALSEVADNLTVAELSGRRPLRVPNELATGRIFTQRMQGLDVAQRQALAVAAVAAEDGLPTVMAVLAEQELGAAALESLEHAGILSLTDNAVRFTHPLLRSEALADVTPPDLRRLHRRVAAALGVPAQVDRRAWHLAASAFGPDEAVARELELTAEIASGRTGYASAATALERAAELSPSERRKARRYAAAAEAARLAGQVDLALRLLTLVEMHTTQPDILVGVAVTRARIELHRGRAEVAVTLWEEAAAALVDWDQAIAALLYAAAGGAAYGAGDPANAIRLARRADELADADSAVVCFTRIVRGSAFGLLGRAWEDGVPELRAASDLARHGEEGVDVEWLLYASLSAAWVGLWEPARTIIEPLLYRLRTSGALGHLPNALYVSALVDSRMGRLESGRASATEAVELANDTSDVLVQCPALGCLALLEAQCGDEQSCRHHAAESMRLRESAGIREMARDVYDALGLLELSLGRPERAIEHLETANRYPTAGPDPVIGRPSSIDLIEAYVRADVPVPTTLSAQLWRLTEHDHPPAIAALLWRGRALLTDDSDFENFFNKALAMHTRATSPFDAGRTYLCFGERLRRIGHRREARAHLEVAHETFQRISARRWADRAAAELTAAGRTGPAPDAHRQLFALTAQELQVAELAANGSTNREIAAQLFLSVKTIEMHLGRAYRKLGVRSRTQLANTLRGGGSA